MMTDDRHFDILPTADDTCLHAPARVSHSTLPPLYLPKVRAIRRAYISRRRRLAAAT